MKNLQNTPPIIVQSKSIGHPINYKWNKKKIDQFLDPSEENEDLENALLQINHKASVGLTAALLEWVYWRYTGYTKMNSDIQKRIEALWFSVDNRENTKPLLFDAGFDISASGHVSGRLWIALMNVRMIDVMYRKGSYLLQGELIGLVLLARNITPKKSTFDKWFSRKITALQQEYPSQYTKDNIDVTDEAIYDSSNEPVICRDFFFNPEFEYTKEASENALEDFVENIDYKTNPFLGLSRKAL
ncbi:hypothetical protein NJT12_23970 [Flavobacterium sp. AC]|uniref:Uncharacterized protein n=1 Tax=Flavobacterium azizsancarii TaxID=2961580 RepID=A0ABT4WLA5_9FLAO|nr:hypothetical protein [Flavobacterium azizsancarii]MDA6072684.1 hypothetical protein [Flavobacterium azizsancarii]